MCFSASASFLAGGSLSAMGVVTLKKTKKNSEIPFAAIPLLFGIQQSIEGVVWLTFSYSWPLVHMIATYAYSMFAYVFWPVFVPFSIRLLEKVAWRRKVLLVLQLIGVAVGSYFFYFIINSHVTSIIFHESIVYQLLPPFIYLAFVFYFIAGCLSCFVSSHKMINFFGALSVLSLFAAYQFYSHYIVSTWCFFAAILSVVVYLYFAQIKPRKSLIK